jgi:hypothetical protein
VDVWPLFKALCWPLDVVFGLVVWSGCCLIDVYPISPIIHINPHISKQELQTFCLLRGPGFPKKNWLKGILSTSCVIFSYPKLLSISVLTFIKWRLTPSYAAKDTIFWQKRPKTIVIRIIVWMTIFKSIHMDFYVNTSWACTLFRNNKQHVVLGQKRNCQCVEESRLWRIQR